MVIEGKLLDHLRRDFVVIVHRFYQRADKTLVDLLVLEKLCKFKKSEKFSYFEFNAQFPERCEHQ